MEEFMVIKAQAAIAAFKMAFHSNFVDASKSNGPLLSAGAMQQEGSHLELKE
jgi:hypothetical protein